METTIKKCANKAIFMATRVSRTAFILLTIGWVSLGRNGFAQDNFPSRPITLIAPLAVGSAGDIAMRELARELAREFGQPVVVENKVGAGGNIGTIAVARAAPNGYTIGMGGMGALIVNQLIYKDPGFDSLKDITLIAITLGLPNVMVVSESSPYKTVHDAIEAYKKKPPESVTYSSSGIGTSMHIAGAMFGHMTQTKLLHIPYTGAPQALAAIASGEVEMGFFNVAAARGLITGKKLRALAGTGGNRMAIFPELPTLNEAGLKGYDFDSWFGLIAPSGTPEAIINKYHSAISKIYGQPAFREKMTAQGFGNQPSPLASPASVSKLIKDELTRWPALLKAAGVEAR